MHRLDSQSLSTASVNVCGCSDVLYLNHVLFPFSSFCSSRLLSVY